MSETIYSVASGALMLGCSEAKVREAVLAGRILPDFQMVRLGSKAPLFRRETLEGWAAQFGDGRTWSRARKAAGGR